MNTPFIIRAFHIEEHTMYFPVLQITFSPTGMPEWVQVSPTKILPGDSVIIDFAIGIKDQENKHIFSRDIVQVDGGGHHFLGEVYYDTSSPGYYLRDEFGEKLKLYQADSPSYKIINNIHQSIFPTQK